MLTTLSKASNSSMDSVFNSRVHQILLTREEIDVLPTAYTEKIREVFTGEYTLWTFETIRPFLAENFDPTVLEAFEKIKPLAFKADLARYCIVYIYGGWYFDLLVTLQSPELIKKFDYEPEVIFFRDIPFARTMLSVVNTLFWFKNPGHPILKNLIKHAVSTILSGEYLEHPHAITGPVAFGKSIAKYQIDTLDFNYLTGDTIMINDKPTHVFNSIEFEDYLPFSNRRGIHEHKDHILPQGYETRTNYMDMYWNRDLYN
jgi:mannosyltransferase OCH1-like enzyme